MGWEYESGRSKGSKGNSEKKAVGHLWMIFNGNQQEIYRLCFCLLFLETQRNLYTNHLRVPCLLASRKHRMEFGRETGAKGA